MEPEMEDDHSDLRIPHSVRFWLFLYSFIASLTCYCFVLYHLFVNRLLRQTLSNHTIIVLLIVNIIYELIGMPLFLSYFYHEGQVIPSLPNVCLLWLFIDEGLFSISLMLIAWASIERYILIFHKQWVSTRKKRILIHYFPLMTLIGSLLLFYSLTLLFPTCENTFEYHELICGSPICAYDAELLGLFDSLCLDILPILIVITFNALLSIRVILHRHRLTRRIDWRRHRKMTVQLLTISTLYFIFYIPEMILELAELLGAPEEFGEEFESYAKFVSYYCIFLLPFATAICIPNLRKKITSIIPFRHRSRTNGQLTIGSMNYTAANQGINAVIPVSAVP